MSNVDSIFHSILYCSLVGIYRFIVNVSWYLYNYFVNHLGIEIGNIKFMIQVFPLMQSQKSRPKVDIKILITKEGSTEIDWVFFSKYVISEDLQKEN